MNVEKKIDPKLSNILVFQDLGCRDEKNISTAAIIVDLKNSKIHPPPKIYKQNWGNIILLHASRFLDVELGEQGEEEWIDRWGSAAGPSMGERVQRQAAGARHFPVARHGDGGSAACGGGGRPPGGRRRLGDRRRGRIPHRGLRRHRITWGNRGDAQGGRIVVHGDSNWAIRASDQRASASDRGCLQGFPDQWGRRWEAKRRADGLEGCVYVWSGAWDGTSEFRGG
jgi:hypothetical protein